MVSSSFIGGVISPTFFTDKALALPYFHAVSVRIAIYVVVPVATKVNTFITFVPPVTFNDDFITFVSLLTGTLSLTVT